MCFRRWWFLVATGDVEQRYLFFFGKSLTPVTHWFCEKFVFFYICSELKTGRYYFFRKSLNAIHSAECQLLRHQLFILHFRCFFCPTKISISYFFCKSLLLNNALVLRKSKITKIHLVYLKKHNFYSLLLFFSKVSKIKLFLSQKKYGKYLCLERILTTNIFSLGCRVSQGVCYFHQVALSSTFIQSFLKTKIIAFFL